MSERPHRRSPYRLAYEGSQAALLAALSRTADCVVTLKRNREAIVEIEVVSRADVLAKASNNAASEFDYLCERYPNPKQAPQAPESPSVDELAPKRTRRRSEP